MRPGTVRSLTTKVLFVIFYIIENICYNRGYGYNVIDIWLWWEKSINQSINKKNKCIVEEVQRHL